MKEKASRIFTYLGLFISLFGITLFSYLFKGINLFGSSYPAKVLFSDFKKWILVIIIILIMKLWEKRDIKSIGINILDIKNVFLGIGFGLIAVIVSILTLGLLFNVLGLEAPSTLSEVNTLPLFIKIFTITTAAITEEIFYRGYAIERIGEITGKYVWGGIISGTIFVAVHFPSWGLAGAIPQIIFTIFLTIFYLKKRDLIAAMAMHWTINFLMIVVLPSFM